MKSSENIGCACTSCQCRLGRGSRTALVWVSSSFERAEWTFADLATRSGRLANALKNLGYKSGDILAVFLPRLPETYLSILAALRLELVTAPLFSSFGEEALRDRLDGLGARGIITRRSLLHRLRQALPRLAEPLDILTIDEPAPDEAPGVLALPTLLAEASPDFVDPATSPSVPSVLHFTSGSTGKPKGVLHRHGAAETIRRTAASVLGLEEGDVFWCTADPGWVTGTSYGIFGPWSLGVTQLQYGGGFNASAWLRLLSEETVTVWYTAPTALRLLMREDPVLFREFPTPRLKRICSVGEPLNPEVIRWARAQFGVEVYDTWFQTETGAIMVANRAPLPVKPGSMGTPVPGMEVAVLDQSGHPQPAGVVGELALKAGFPSLFIEYVHQPEATRAKFAGPWYRSGDQVRMDPDGYFHFVGRADDVINTAGHLVGPFEVESALLELPEVAECAATAVADPVLFEKVAVFIRLAPGAEPSEDLALRVRIHVSSKVSSIAAPGEVRFVDHIPKNRSGKILRRALRAALEGADPGDLSTMEE